MFVFKKLNKKYPFDVQALAYFNQEIDNELIVIINCMQQTPYLASYRIVFV